MVYAFLQSLRLTYRMIESATEAGVSLSCLVCAGVFLSDFSFFPLLVRVMCFRERERERRGWWSKRKRDREGMMEKKERGDIFFKVASTKIITAVRGIH